VCVPKIKSTHILYYRGNKKGDKVAVLSNWNGAFNKFNIIAVGYVRLRFDDALSSDAKMTAAELFIFPEAKFKTSDSTDI
jgi:hypothetical protein